MRNPASVLVDRRPQASTGRGENRDSSFEPGFTALPESNDDPESGERLVDVPNIPARLPIPYNTGLRAGCSSRARRGAGVAERG